MKVTSKELSSVAGVGPSAITNSVKRGKLIRIENKFFDLEDPINKSWCVKKGVDPGTCKKMGTVKTAGKKTKQTKKKTEQDQKKNTDQDEETIDPSTIDGFETLTGLPQKMMGLTLRQLVMKYGGPMQLKGWVDILDKLMSAQKKDVEIQEKRKDLVPRKFVEYLKQYVDTYNNQLFDYADGCTSDLIAILKSSPKKAKIKIGKLLRKEFSKLASETTRRIDKDIKNLKVTEDAD